MKLILKAWKKNQEKALNVIHVYNGNHSTCEELLAISKSPSLKIRVQ
jgi:hypothetical protein